MFNINKFNKEIEAVKKLREAQSNLSLEKQEEIKSRILNTIASQSLEEEPESFWFKYHRKAVQYSLVLVICLMVFGSTAFASSNALPGEILYPVKRVTEKLQLNVATSEEAKVNLQARFAQKRLQELGELHKRTSIEILPAQIVESTSTPATTTLEGIVNIKKELKFNKVKLQETEVEKKAKEEARVEVKEALENLRKVYKKLEAKGEIKKAEVLQKNITNLKDNAFERDIKDEDKSELDDRSKLDRNNKGHKEEIKD